jgi:hypothetical protein
MKNWVGLFYLSFVSLGWSQYEVPVVEQMNMHVLYLNYPTTLRIEAKEIKESFTLKYIKIRKTERNDNAFKPKGKYLDKEIQVQTLPASGGNLNSVGAGFRLTLVGNYFKRKDYLRVEFWQKDSLYTFRDYELRKLPLPVLYWNGLKSGLFQKERGALDLTLAYGETSILREMNFAINEWVITVEGLATEVKGTGNQLNMEASKFLKSLPAKSTIFIRGAFSGSGFDHESFEGSYQL